MAITEIDPVRISELILIALTEALDITAPEKRIQLKKTEIDFLTDPTRVLQAERDRLQRIAHETNSVEDWRIFRLTRNLARQSLKKDKNAFFKDKLTSGNSNQIWNAAKRLAGEKISGPPTKLFENGHQETSPGKISEILNGSFINKIVDIRQSFGQNPNRIDPLISYRPCQGRIWTIHLQ